MIAIKSLGSHTKQPGFNASRNKLEKPAILGWDFEVRAILGSSAF